MDKHEIERLIYNKVNALNDHSHILRTLRDYEAKHNNVPELVYEMTIDGGTGCSVGDYQKFFSTLDGILKENPTWIFSHFEQEYIEPYDYGDSYEDGYIWLKGYVNTGSIDQDIEYQELYKQLQYASDMIQKSDDDINNYIVAL